MQQMMFMLAAAVSFFAIGDLCGVATKAKMSSVFVALMLFLVLFMTGVIPADIIKQAGLAEIGRWATPVVVFSMGTMIDLKELAKEWRTVLMSVIAMIVAMAASLAVIPFLGKEAVLVAIPVINGGIVSTQIMVDAAMTKGFAFAAGFGTIAYAVQKFVGTPPASYFGLKEAELIVADYRKKKENITEAAKAAEKKTFAQKHATYFTPFTCFAITAIGGTCAVALSGVTSLHNSIWSLILGATAGYFGITPKNILEHGKSSGFMNMAIFASIIPSLAQIKPADLLTMSWQLVVLFAAVLIGTYIFIYLLPTWKLVGSRNLSVGIAMAQLLGFPATYLIANEIATAVGESDEERKHILAKIAPAYIVAGFASVTTISIVIAGFFVKFL